MNFAIFASLREEKFLFSREAAKTRRREDFLRLGWFVLVKTKGFAVLRLCARRKVFIFSREIHIKKNVPARNLPAGTPCVYF